MPLPAPDGPVIDEDGPAPRLTVSPAAEHQRLKRLTSSARWRSESPPTVFDWLMRHWFSSRAAFTRPNFGTAISMSNTFAVETYSGGSSRIPSMPTLAVLQVLLQLRPPDANVVGPLERLHPLIERAGGAWACVFEVTMSGRV